MKSAIELVGLLGLALLIETGGIWLFSVPKTHSVPVATWQIDPIDKPAPLCNPCKLPFIEHNI